jgi:hypothetical protein
MNLDTLRGKLEILSVVEIPNYILGDIQKFKNYDPTRIIHYELKGNHLCIYMEENKRLEAMEEFRSTVEALQYQVERKGSPLVRSFESFQFDTDLANLIFVVKKELFERDFTAKVIEKSIVEDALKYQIYSRKAIGVRVYYRDAESNKLIRECIYPKSSER